MKGNIMATTATKPQKRKRQAAKPSRLANCDSDADVRASLKEYRPANRACEWMDVVLILRHNNDGDNDVIGSFEVFDYSGHGCERLYARLVKAAREHVEESKSSQTPSDSGVAQRTTSEHGGPTKEMLDALKGKAVTA
jgi:hypothetical protein